MSPRPVEAALVTVGEELLSGATVDGNAAWLGARLGEVGIPVRRRATVGDRDDDIAEVVREASSRSPLVVVTGGLGPTEDDRTRPAVAAALGLPLMEDPQIVAVLRARTEAAGRGEPTAELLRLALRPDGARVLDNPAGAAPGLAIPAGEAPDAGWVVLLPGVPREMRAIFPAVAALVRETFPGRLRPVATRLIHTTGIPESVLAPRVEAALGTHRRGLEVAYLPDLTGVDLRLTVAEDPGPGGSARAREILDAAEAAVEPVVAEHRFGAASGDLVEALAAELESRGWWLATAESCTGGMVAQRWTARPGASRTFRGGVVAYADEVKEGWLGVRAVDLDRHGAVSESVARQMALGVCEAMETECGIGITGVAGPDGGTDEKPVGTVWIGVTAPGLEGRERAVSVFRANFAGDREAIRVRASQAALHALYRLVVAPPAS